MYSAEINGVPIERTTFIPFQKKANANKKQADQSSFLDRYEFIENASLHTRNNINVTPLRDEEESVEEENTNIEEIKEEEENNS